MFSYQTHGESLSLFLLLDYAGPHTFPADGTKRGVGEHPHRGFETVTIVYSARWSIATPPAEAASLVRATQWMTAGAGILHEEFHPARSRTKAENLKMMQLWVNLLAKDKMAYAGLSEHYQSRYPGGDVA